MIKLSQRLSFSTERIQASSIESKELHAMIVKIANYDSVQLVHNNSPWTIQFSFLGARCSNGLQKVSLGAENF